MTKGLKSSRRGRERPDESVPESDTIGGNEASEAASKNQISSEKLLKLLQFNHRHGYGEYEIKKDKET